MGRRILIYFFWIPATFMTLAAASMLLLTHPHKVSAEPEADIQQNVLGIDEYHLYAALPDTVENINSAVATGDARPEILRNFFTKHNSPLVTSSQFLVDLADIYNLDFRMLPAIAMQESNLCKKIPENSFNCWGFGIYGDKVTRFASYNQAAEAVAKTLRSKYVDRGLLSPEEIQSKYTPQSNGSWSKAVSHFMDQMK